MANDVEKRVSVKYILDSTGLNEGLQGINQQLKINQSELKNASVGVQAFGKTSDGLKSVQQKLTEQVDLSTQKLDIYKESVGKASEKLQDSVAVRDRLKTELDNEKIKLEAATKAYGQNSTVTQQARENVADLTEKYKASEDTVKSNAKTLTNYTTSMNNTNAELEKAQGHLSKVNKELAESQNKWVGAGKALQDAGKKIKSVGDGMSSTGKDLTVGITVPAIAAGTALYKIGSDFDEASDKIRAGTGKTGEALNGLKEDFKAVYGSVPASMDDASTAITELNKRLDMTGKPLQDLAKQELELSRVTKSDLSTTIQSSTRMFQDAGIKQQDYASALDYTFRVSQQTGIGIDRLQQLMTQFGGPLRQMGFDWQTSAAMLGKFEKEGVNTELVVGSLRIALGKMAKEGIKDPAQALDTMIKKIKEAGTAGQANTLALQMFGAKAGPDMAAAIREGRLDLDKLISTLKNSPETINSAAQDTMSLSEKFTLLKNNLAVKLQPVAEKLLDEIDKSIPTIEKIANSVVGLIDKFNKLSPSTQAAIGKFALMAVAAGPVLSVGGKIVSVGGSVVGTVGKISSALGAAQVATAGASAATGAATVATGGLAAGLGSAALAVLPWAAGIAAAGVGAYALYKHLSKEAVPAIDLFKDKTIESTKVVTDEWGNTSVEVEKSTVKITESTKKAVGAYIKLDDDAKGALQDLYVSSTAITDQTVGTMTQKYADMGTQIKAGMDKKNAEMYASMQTFFQNSDTLTATEEQKSLQSLQSNNNAQKAEIDRYTKEIQTILQNAASQHRSITQSEQETINSIQDKMRENAVKSLSDDEVQSKVIMERLKGYDTRITAEQASEVIKNAEKQRQGAVQKANEQCDQTVATIIRMRDESHTITSKQADELIADAQRQKDESLQKADELKQGVVDKLDEMNSDTEKNVDTSTGKILSNWDKIKRWWNGWAPAPKTMKVETVTTTAQIGSGGKGRMLVQNAAGTDYFQGGLTSINERGYEIVDLPRGTRILNHDASQDLVKQMANKMANTTQHVIHSGTITVKGVNNQDELIGVYNMLLDKLEGEVRA